jgi:formate hydrogenlyase transcriptional activator
VTLVERVAGAVAVAVDNCFAHEELQRLRDRLSAENVYLQEEIQQGHNFAEIVGKSPALGKVLSLVETVAPTSSTVLVLGETGTGKELVARAIHDRSPRRDRPLVKVNCSAISAGLVESELFGHVRGAFTGAVGARTGRFEVADGGTLFLDEIGDLPLETQVKLLRVLQEREIEPVGSSQPRKVDVRVIAATNRDLEQEVAAGRFRADLYFRLNVVPVLIPPLREREGDVALLACFFADRFAREFGKRIERIAPEALERLAAYRWPGNVRELSNVIERTVVLARGPLLDVPAELLPGAPTAAPAPSAGAAPAAPADPPPAHAPGQTLEEIERRHIQGTLERTGWVIEGERGAAAALGLSASTLRSRLKKLGVRRPAR